MIVVIAIITILTLGSIVGYQQISQGITLSRAHESIDSVVNERRLEVLNGNKTCAEMYFNNTQKFFTSFSSESANCNDPVPYITNFLINEENQVSLNLNHTDPLLLRFSDDRGNIEQFEFEAGSNDFSIEASDTMHYSFVLYDPQDLAANKVEGHFQYFAQDNLDPGRVNHIFVSEIIGTDPDLQAYQGESLKIQFYYPNAMSKVYVDGKLMKSAELILEKSNTTLDPISVALSSVVDSDTERTNMKASGFFYSDLAENKGPTPSP